MFIFPRSIVAPIVALLLTALLVVADALLTAGTS
jgi:hypothetical protein